MLKLSRRRIRHEDVVTEQYALLRRAALHLARGDETEAGDLLHDTVVRFLLLRPDLGRIERLDGYLYTMLRNVYLSRQRRLGRRNALIADGVDVDLLAGMIDEPRTGDRLRLHDDLIRIVAHACERTRVSRGASAWVLRCLHGYYPMEIAHVMKMPPRAVDRALHVARREALEELRRPSRRLLARLRGSRGTLGAPGGRRWRDLHDDDVSMADPFEAVQALRTRVFASVNGPCLTEHQLVELYGARASELEREPDGDSDCDSDGDSQRELKGEAPSDDPVGTLVMAHVVACASCLDRINHYLGLSPLHLRDPLEASGTRRPRGGGAGGNIGSTGNNGTTGGGAAGGSASGGGAARGRGKARKGDGADPLLRRANETISSIVNHVPRELRIAANGFDLGAQPVTGAVTSQELAVRLAEALAFIEIFDERGALVCYWPAKLPNDDALEEQTTIELGDGRQVDLQVSLTGDCPRLRMRYTDERVSAAPAAAAGPRAVRADDGRRLLTALAITGAVGADRVHDSWWRWVVPSRFIRSRFIGWRIIPSRFMPSPRVAAAVGVLVVLWMILVGPATTWAALAEFGRAAADAIRTLISSSRSSPSSSAPASAPARVLPAAAPAPPPEAIPARSTAAARVFSASELADLEMDARVTLHAMKADLGEDISLISSPAGIVIQGVVSSGARRVAISRAFTDREGVRVRVRTVNDVAAGTRMKSTRAPASASNATSDAGTAAGDAVGAAAAGAPVKVESPESLRPILEDVLIARFPEPAPRAAFVNATLAHADEALTRAWALRRLAERYPAREASRLGPRSSQALATLVDDHVAALRSAIDALATRITPLLGAPVDEALANDQLSVMQMFEDANALHAETHALLAGGSAATAAPPVASPATAVSLRLRRIAHASSQPHFAHELRPR